MAKKFSQICTFLFLVLSDGVLIRSGNLIIDFLVDSLNGILECLSQFA
jgi:hypothetical protein